MKKVYNKYSTSDVPLEASLDLSSGPTPKASSSTTKKKATIQAVGSKAKTTKSTKTSQASKEKGTVRKKVAKDSIDLQELEKLNEESIQSHSFRSKRNQVIIIILSLLLAIAIAFIVIFVVINRKENNCFVNTYGSVEAVHLIDGEELTEFRCPANIMGECILEFNVDLKINESGNFKVKYTIKCYQNDRLLSNVVVYEPNTKETGFTYKNDGFYHSKSTISGNSTIRLCQGVALNEFDADLNDKNFKLEIHTYIERV